MTKWQPPKKYEYEHLVKDYKHVCLAEEAKCPCGFPLAYEWRDNCWNCLAIILDIADSSVKHTDRLPFAFWKVKGRTYRDV